MNEQEQRDLIEGYLRRLDAALADVPGAARRELIEDVRGHIAEAWENAPERNRATMLNILDRLGEPEELAREERERLGIKPVDESRHEVLSWAAVVLTVIFWPAGVILAWLSSRWTVVDKAIATLLPVVGLVLTMSLSMVAFTSTGQAAVTNVEVGVERVTPSAESTAPTQAPGPEVDWGALAIRALAFYGLLGAPLTSAAYLALRLRRRAHRGIALVPVLVGSLLVIVLLLGLSFPAHSATGAARLAPVAVTTQQVR